MTEAHRKSMAELFHIAREFGRVYIFTTERGTYNVSIKFNTIAHVALEAASRFDHSSVEEALEFAIKRAQEIVKSVTDDYEKFKQLATIG